MKYFVTFGAQDSDADGNPLWHSFLLLSQQKDGADQLEVYDHWGFYGLPSTDGEGIKKSIKKKLLMDTNVYGNHGMLIHEKLRFLDLGRGFLMRHGSY